jgi:hypothetical protein
MSWSSKLKPTNFAIISVSGKIIDLKVYSLDGSVVKDYSFAS